MFAGIEDMRLRSPNVDIARYANVLAAMGMASRLRIMRLLLSAHPDGLVVGHIQKQLGFTASNLSCHLKKLKNQKLVIVRRDGTRLWYSANVGALEELLRFLHAQCCMRNRVFSPDRVVQIKA